MASSTGHDFGEPCQVCTPLGHPRTSFAARVQAMADRNESTQSRRTSKLPRMLDFKRNSRRHSSSDPCPQLNSAARHEAGWHEWMKHRNIPSDFSAGENPTLIPSPKRDYDPNRTQVGVKSPQLKKVASNTTNGSQTLQYLPQTTYKPPPRSKPKPSPLPAESHEMIDIQGPSVSQYNTKPYKVEPPSSVYTEEPAKAESWGLTDLERWLQGLQGNVFPDEDDTDEQSSRARRSRTSNSYANIRWEVTEIEPSSAPSLPTLEEDEPVSPQTDQMLGSWLNSCEREYGGRRYKPREKPQPIQLQYSRPPSGIVSQQPEMTSPDMSSYSDSYRQQQQMTSPDMSLYSGSSWQRQQVTSPDMSSYSKPSRQQQQMSKPDMSSSSGRSRQQQQIMSPAISSNSRPSRQHQPASPTLSPTYRPAGEPRLVSPILVTMRNGRQQVQAPRIPVRVPPRRHRGPRNYTEWMETELQPFLPSADSESLQDYAVRLVEDLRHREAHRRQDEEVARTSRGSARSSLEYPAQLESEPYLAPEDWTWI